jgi:hypothetical protein
VKRTTNRPVSRAVRDLTGWDESALASSIDPNDAWARLADAARLRGGSMIAPDSANAARPVPTVIHFARFEMPFLAHLHRAAGGSDETFPLDIICLHAVACRLFPALPRRNLRALAGHLGGSPEIVRRSKGHVEATGVVWRGIVPMLAREGVHTWSELKAWLDATPAPSSRAARSKRQFPISSARRRALPDEPGVYRFLRPNGDVLYVGKAASLKRRVASHFTTGARATERSLEMLSQAHEIDVTVVGSALEAALLEADEIKRLNPPYNVHLRADDRFAWFATRDWSHAAQALDAQHCVGPLPSRFSVWGIAAMRALLDGEPSVPRFRAAAVGVPVAFAPDEAMFDDVWKSFAAEHLSGERAAKLRILDASARIVPSDRPEEEEGATAAPRWDATTIRRYLERTIVGEGTVVRRARLLALLTDAHVIFREPEGKTTRFIAIEGGGIAGSRTLAEEELASISLPPSPPSLHARLAGFDAARYDRLRVLATELRRVAAHGGRVEVRVGRHAVGGAFARFGAILPAGGVGYAP